MKKLEYSNKLKEHINLIYKERSSYKNKTLIAKNDPNSAISIIIDGSDMSCYGLPYFCDKSKSTQIGHKIPIKLVGVIVHGIGSYIYLIHKNWPSDPNLTIEILHRTFIKLGKEKIPKILYLQVIFINKIIYNLIK